MERKKGFIDLNKLLDIPFIFSKSVDRNFKIFKDSPKLEVIKASMWSKFNFRFSYDGMDYYFKYDKDISPYSELIVEELARDFKIPHITYDLAKFGRFKGVISSDYKQSNAKYIEGWTLLNQYGNKKNEDISEDDLAKYDYPNSINTIESIWVVLEQRYKDRENKNEIVSNLMSSIVDLFIFDLLTCQADRHANNWGILEYENGKVSLLPIFDNERIVSYKNFDSAFLKMTLESIDDKFYSDNVKAFLEHSSDEFTSRLIDNVWIVSPENILKVMARVEVKTRAPIPKKVKEYYLERYSKVYNFLSDVLEKYTSKGR